MYRVLMYMERVRVVCLVCNKAAESAKSLKAHLQSVHQISTEFYTLKYLFFGVRPLCKCGCSLITRYFNFGYKNFRTGHNGYKINISNKSMNRKFNWESKQ